MEYHDDDEDSHYPTILAELAGDFFPIFVYIFVVILVGYLAGRLSVLPTGRGRSVLASFIFNIALPAGILSNMITIKLKGLNDSDQSSNLPTFLGCVMIVKSLLYVLVLVVGLIIIRNSAVNWAVVVLFALATVHSNDYGIGQSMLHVLFDNSTLGPARDYPMYMDASIQISYLSFVPISIFFLELKRNRDLSLKWGKSIFYASLRCLLRPIIMAAIIGIILRLALRVDDDKNPKYLKPFMKWFGGRILVPFIATISPIYLIYTGVVLAGNVRQFIRPREVMAIIVVTILKLGFSPLMMKFISKIIFNVTTSDSSNNTLPVILNLYGTLPTSPILVIIASQYDLFPQIFAMVVLLTTLAFAPIATFFLALSYLDSADLYSAATVSVVNSVSEGIGCATVVLAVWMLFVLLLLQRYRKVMYRLLLAQILCLSCYCALTAAIKIEELKGDMKLKAVAFGKGIATCLFCVLGCTYMLILGIADKGSTDMIQLMHSARAWTWYVITCLVAPVLLLALTSLPWEIKEPHSYDYVWDLCNNVSDFFVATKIIILVAALVLGMLPMFFSFCNSERMRRTLERLRYEPILEETTELSRGLRNYHRSKMGRNNSLEASEASTMWEMTEADVQHFQAAGIMSIVMTMVTLLVESWSLFEEHGAAKEKFVGLVVLYQNLWLFVGLGMAVTFGTPVGQLREKLVKLKEAVVYIFVRDDGELNLPQLERLPPETVLTLKSFQNMVVGNFN